MSRVELEAIEVSITAVALKAGVVVSVTLLVAGMILETLQPANVMAALRPEGILTLPSRIASGSGIALVHLGLLVLMVTPLVRVVVLAVEFIRERDYSFAMISGGVLLLLFVSFALGAVG